MNFNHILRGSCRYLWMSRSIYPSSRYLCGNTICLPQVVDKNVPLISSTGKQYLSTCTIICNIEPTNIVANTITHKTTGTEAVQQHVSTHEPSLYSHSLVQTVCQALLDAGVMENTLKQCLCITPVPVIFKMPLKRLKETLKVFNKFAVNPDTALCLIVSYNENFNFAVKQLEASLMQLQEITIRDLSLINFIDTSPYLLTMDMNQIIHMLHNLKSLFPPKELRHLLRNCPDIFIYPWRETERKIFYINDEMKLDQPHMSYNRTLSHTSAHIRNRHEVLRRLGKYKPPSLHKDRLSYLKNPKLELIMDSSDKQFCIRVAGISEEEWQVFQELMSEEYGETVDGVPLDASDDEDEEYLKELLENRKSYGVSKKKSKGVSMVNKRWKN